MNIRHHGNWVAVGRLTVADGELTLDVYECPVCFALTREPMDHADHHIRYRTTRVGAA